MIQRHIQNSIRRAMADTPVVLLNGARQTGKTTPAQAMAGESRARYFTLDDSATFALAAGDPSGFIQKRERTKTAIILRCDSGLSLFRIHFANKRIAA